MGWNGFVDGSARHWAPILIGVLMLIICADVAVRNIMGGSLPLISEAGRSHAGDDRLPAACHDRPRRPSGPHRPLLPGFRGAFRARARCCRRSSMTRRPPLGVIAWSTITDPGERTGTRGEYIGVTGIATLPTWPFRAADPAGRHGGGDRIPRDARGSAMRAAGGGDVTRSKSASRYRRS
jgi:hypothetical protein